MKLFSIVATFDKKQWSGYLTYIGLYHKPESVICKVASWLDTQTIWKKKGDDAITADGLLSQLTFDMRLQSFSNTLATLGNLAEEYVGWMVWKNSQQLKISCQLQGLAQKGLNDEYIKTQKEVLRNDKNKVISIWEDYYKMRTLFDDYHYQINHSEDNFTDQFENLLQYFKSTTATIAQFLLVEIKNREKLLSESREEDTKFFELLSQQESELKIITDKLILLNQKGDANAYEYLKQVLYSDDILQYSKYIQYSIVTYIKNYLIGITKQGEIKKAEDLFYLFEYSFQRGIFNLNDTMQLRKFMNIIGLASKFQKYEWARTMVNKWAIKVDPYNAKSIAKFGHAKIDFHMKRYENVVSELSQMKFANFQHRLRSRWLLLSAQYEISQDYIEVMKIQIDNFRRFLVSNESRITKSTFEGMKSSMRILNMILSRKPIEQIKAKYRTANFIYERRWIGEKIKNPA